MDDNQTDAWVIASSHRAPARFAIVFDRHFDTIYRYLERRAGRDVADELSGEVFRIGFEQRSRFRPVHQSALPWLYGLATNLLLKHWRRSARELRAFERLGRNGGEPASESAAVDARLDAGPLGRRLVSALADLPDGDRDVVVLVAWEELSYEEVAAALGIPEGTVRSRLHRARRKLLASLGAEDEQAPALTTERT